MTLTEALNELNDLCEYLTRIDYVPENLREETKRELVKAYSKSEGLFAILRSGLNEYQKLLNQLKDGDLSDGYHTFNDLYHQRAVLFAALVNSNPDISWKSIRHEDEELCFGGGWFIVGINTPQGNYTYHYEAKYWDMFKCQVLGKAPYWDGHTDKDVERLLSLVPDKDEVAQGQMSIYDFIED